MSDAQQAFWLQAPAVGPKTAFIYHSPCPDGTWAALPFWLSLTPEARARLAALLGEGVSGPKEKAYVRPDRETAQKEGLPLFIRARPGDYPPACDLEGYKVYLLDFCYTESAMGVLIKKLGSTGKVLILDHHKTNLETMLAMTGSHPRQIQAVFDMAQSGAEIAWSFARAMGIFTGPDSRLKDYVGDRDTWKFALPNSREVNAALRAMNLGLGTLEDVAQAYRRELEEPDWIDKLAEAGAHYLTAQQEIVKSITSAGARAFVTVDDKKGDKREYEIMVVNSPTLQSEIGHALAARPLPGQEELPAFVAVWYYNHPTDDLRISLRTCRPEVDLSQIAPNIVGVIGGGGHPAAAGCCVKGSDVKAIFRPC